MNSSLIWQSSLKATALLKSGISRALSSDLCLAQRFDLSVVFVKVLKVLVKLLKVESAAVEQVF